MKNIQLHREKDYTKAYEMYYSSDWNEFYTGMLMLSELDIFYGTKTFSDNWQLDGLEIEVSYRAQIQMHIWYSILKSKSFRDRYIVADYRELILEKAKIVWGELADIGKKLRDSEDLIIPEMSHELKQYGMDSEGNHAWSIHLDNSNRFVYLPYVNQGTRKIVVISCMFHYKDLPKDQIIKTSSQKRDNQMQFYLQGCFEEIHGYLTSENSDQIVYNELREIVKYDYLTMLFANPNLIKLGNIK